jgi:hypothetical protein
MKNGTLKRNVKSAEVGRTSRHREKEEDGK